VPAARPSARRAASIGDRFARCTTTFAERRAGCDESGMRLVLAVLLLALPACAPRTIDDRDAGVVTLDAGVLSCIDDDQCPTGRCRSGICSTDECASKTDCAAGLVCVDGACTTPPAQCAGSDECPGNSVCDGFSRSCIDPDASGCVLAADCALEPGCDDGCTCDDGACIPDAPGDAGGPTGDALDLSGFVLENRENEPPQQITVLPDGLTIEAGGVLVIARAADRADFESYWGPLPSTAEFLNANIEGSGVPVVNGGERFAIRSPVGTLLDGPTIAGETGMVYRRTSTAEADQASAWTVGGEADATPGAVEIGGAPGLVITEWGDATGGGNFVYEYVELAYLP
jgi:hypothetical protein